MKKYTLEERQSALAMMKTMGMNYTSTALKIAKGTLIRWRREAELETLISPINPCDDAKENTLPITVVEEETAVTEENTSKQKGRPLNTSALDEAAATIALLTHENARLVEIIKQLRSVIRGMTDVV